jgi:hypothetical protein
VDIPLKTTYGGLKDADRIFTNIYGDHDWHIDAAIKRVRRSDGSTRFPFIDVPPYCLRML